MIAKNLQIIENLILESCLKSGRKRSEIKLIAVSKTQPIELIKEVLSAGIIHLGENKAQEMREKAKEISGKFYWHFIGHLQTNKVKYIIESAEYIHSVDSRNLVDEINRKAESIGKKQKVLLEMKTSNEATKFGLETEKQVYELADYCLSKANIELVGLMTMAPYTKDSGVIRKCFSKLKEIKEKLNKDGFPILELSMGMTNDFQIAIEEGATMIRIGTAIFGERNYN